MDEAQQRRFSLGHKGVHAAIWLGIGWLLLMILVPVTCYPGWSVYPFACIHAIPLVLLIRAFAHRKDSGKLDTVFRYLVLIFYVYILASVIINGVLTHMAYYGIWFY
jgi:galactitol-specific phosphotransferase system IIC component